MSGLPVLISTPKFSSCLLGQLTLLPHFQVSYIKTAGLFHCTHVKGAASSCNTPQQDLN